MINTYSLKANANIFCSSPFAGAHMVPSPLVHCCTLSLCYLDAETGYTTNATNSIWPSREKNMCEILFCLKSLHCIMSVFNILLINTETQYIKSTLVNKICPMTKSLDQKTGSFLSKRTLSNVMQDVCETRFDDNLWIYLQNKNVVFTL